MAPRKHTARRKASDELAALIAAGDGLHAARLLQVLGVMQEAPRTHARDEPRTGPEPIGIWQPRDGGIFERIAPDRVTSLLWDPRPTLEAKKPNGVKRVCLLGESAAAGWFYAPHVTPASVLESYLGASEYEVINLARVDLDASDLVALARASRQLDPDTLVVYAGNNWGVHFGTADNVTVAVFHTAARAYRADGAAGLMRVTGDAIRAQAEATLDALAKAADGVPVVIVVPEVNLAHWERARPVPWLPGDACQKWYALFDEARFADPGAQERAARAMIALDGGVCSTSHRLLSNALAEQGDLDGARDAARAEVTARSWDNHPHTPGVTPAVQEIIRESAAKHGFKVVDLPALAGSLPGRELLLDYCHLTLDGMRVAMGAVAREISGRSDEWQRPSAPPSVDARARFLASLYGTHWSSQRVASTEVHGRWLREAMDVWPEIVGEVNAYVQTRCANPEWLECSIAQQRVKQSGADLDGRVLRGPTMDVASLAMMTSVAPVEDELIASHAIDRDGANLLDNAYAWAILDRYETSAAFSHPRRAFHRAVWPTSRFALPVSASSKLRLAVAARLRHHCGSATILINDRRVGTMALTESWTPIDVDIPESVLVDGINCVSIAWPPLPSTGDDAMREITRRLELGQATEIHPTFGELFRLEIHPV